MHLFISVSLSLLVSGPSRSPHYLSHLLCVVHFSSQLHFDETFLYLSQRTSNWFHVLKHCKQKQQMAQHYTKTFTRGLITSIFVFVVNDLLVWSYKSVHIYWWVRSVLHSVSVQALELRESCVCPALPGTDPRAVFSKSVRVLLENAKDQGRAGPEGALKPHLPHSPVSLPTGLPGPALLAETALPPSPNADQESKSSVPSVTSELAVAVPAPAEREGSSWQDH